MKKLSTKQILRKKRLDKKRFANSVKRKARNKILSIQAEKLKIKFRRQSRSIMARKQQQQKVDPKKEKLKKKQAQDRRNG